MTSIRVVRTGLIINAFFSFIMVMSSIFIIHDFGFSYELKSETLGYVIFDAILNAVVFLIFFIFFKNKLNKELGCFVTYSVSKIDALFPIILFIMFISIYQASISLKLILAGVVRHELILEYSRMGITYIIISNFFKIITPIVLFFDCKTKTKVACVIGLISVLIITASRNELAFVAYMIFFMMSYKFTKKMIGGIALLSCFLVFIAFLATVFLQGRPISEGFDGIIDVLKTHLLYKIYSYYLSELSVIAGQGFEKIFYPFMGFIYERIISVFFILDRPIDTKFVSEYLYLGYNIDWGSSYIANVVYPWWSWFVAQFGFMGVIIKAVYSFAIMNTLLRFRMLITLTYFSCFLIYFSPGGTLFLTANAVMTFFIAMSIDFIVKRPRYIEWK